MQFAYQYGNNRYGLSLNRQGENFEAVFEGTTYRGSVREIGPGFLEIRLPSRRVRVHVAAQGRKCHVFLNGGVYQLERISPTASTGDDEAPDDLIISPITGKLTALNVAPEDTVKKGDTLAMIEAMKMEHRLKAPRDGVVARVCDVSVSQQIDEGELVVELEALE